MEKAGKERKTVSRDGNDLWVRELVGKYLLFIRITIYAKHC